MKQRDAAVSAQDNRGGTSEAKLAQKGGADSAAAVAAATATAALQQQRARGLEEKVADLQSKLEHALAEKDRLERTISTHAWHCCFVFSCSRRCEQDAIVCAAHAQEAAANVEQMASIVKVRPSEASSFFSFV
jgi:hypothetical protein